VGAAVPIKHANIVYIPVSAKLYDCVPLAHFSELYSVQAINKID
jgi:hypothetical protein